MALQSSQALETFARAANSPPIARSRWARASESRDRNHSMSGEEASMPGIGSTAPVAEVNQRARTVRRVRGGNGRLRDWQSAALAAALSGALAPRDDCRCGGDETCMEAPSGAPRNFAIQYEHDCLPEPCPASLQGPFPMGLPPRIATCGETCQLLRISSGT